MAYALAFFGLLLVFLECFLPGGIAATCGTLLLLLSMVIFVYGHAPLPGVGYVLLLLFLTGVIVRAALLQIKKRKNSLYLVQDQEGFVAVSFIREFIGKKGVAQTALRPAGNVLVGERMVQAVSSGEYIEKGRPVKVIGGEGARLIVAPITQQE